MQGRPIGHTGKPMYNVPTYTHTIWQYIILVPIVLRTGNFLRRTYNSIIKVSTYEIVILLTFMKINNYNILHNFIKKKCFNYYYHLLKYNGTKPHITALIVPMHQK